MEKRPDKDNNDQQRPRHVPPDHPRLPRRVRSSAKHRGLCLSGFGVGIKKPEPYIDGNEGEHDQSKAQHGDSHNKAPCLGGPGNGVLAAPLELLDDPPPLLGGLLVFFHDLKGEKSKNDVLRSEKKKRVTFLIQIGKKGDFHLSLDVFSQICTHIQFNLPR